uniref:Membrane frizzled-related protein n=1 Tax=Gouania willdenowi TaxID=441366 RepID=A0A8C5DMG5_GOUWI
VEDQLLPTSTANPADEASHLLFTLPTNRSHINATVAPPPTNCGGVMTYSEGSVSSPNYPGSYPPNSLCMWVIRVPPPTKVQIHVSSLRVEGPSPCLFDWLEVQEQTQFCGNVAPPTINTNSSTVWLIFHSDGSITGNGFTAQYRAVQPGQESCSADEFKCDGGRCLLSVSVCDGQPNCQDQTDEADCSHKHKGESESLQPYSTYTHNRYTTWTEHQLFRNFSLETQDVCEFDYVEVHDSASTGAGRVLGRFCGTTVPPDLTSSGPHMTVVFVTDEGVSDSGFNASYQAVSVLGSRCSWLYEQSCGNSTYPPFSDSAKISSCEQIEVEMCLGLSYNLTSFPNIWLSIADQREAASLLQQYRVLMELACFEPLQRLLCGMFLPQCRPQGGVLQPCRSICSSAEQQCSQALDLFSFSWPFNCHLLPNSQDPIDCSLP